MRLIYAFLILSGLLFTACPSSDPGTSSGIDSVACEQLDRLMGEINEMDSMLENGGEWQHCKAKLSLVAEIMDDNIRLGAKECSYLNQQNYPDHARFMFVEALSQRIIRDTLQDGIYYLVRLRGIFSDDANISEYFSEELAHLAVGNPDSYLGYLRENPDQEVMLLYSTRWNYLDADSLISRFSRSPGSFAVVEYLKDWKQKHDEEGN